MSEPRFLLLETSSRRGLLALGQGGRLLTIRSLDESRRNARDLAPTLASLLDEQGWTARQLQAVFVGRGPGSYTGLRVGLMSAKTLAYATGCSLLGIETFAVIARQSPAECPAVHVLADAQQDKVYQRAYVRTPEGWHPSGDLVIVRFEEWSTSLAEGSWVSGPGLTRWQGKIPSGVRCLPEACWQPGAEALLALGHERWQRGERDDPLTLEPLYLRASSAEEQWRASSRSP